jgi:hypothetical protein
MTTKQKLGLGVVLALVAFTASFLGSKVAVISSPSSPSLGGGAYEALPKWFGNGFQAGSSQQFTVDNQGSLTTTGTTTVAASYDGYFVYGAFTMATGTAKAVYTNTYGPAVCGGANGAIFASSTPFAPSIRLALGTSTSATGYSTNLLASTTVATSTRTLIPLTSSLFVLNPGDSIVGAISDITNTEASSTYMANWTVSFSLECRLIGA